MGATGLVPPTQPRPCPPQAASPSSVPIVLAVVAVLLITAVTGVLLIKKYVCGGR